MATEKRNPVAIAVFIGICLVVLGLVGLLSWYLADTKAWPWIPAILVMVGLFVFREVVRQKGDERLVYSILLGLLVVLFIVWFAAGAKKFYQQPRDVRSGRLEPCGDALFPCGM